MDGLEVGDVDEEEQTPHEAQPEAHPQSPGQACQEKGGNGVNGDDEEVEETGIVSSHLVGEVLDQIGGRTARRLLLLRREEEGEVLSHGDVVMESLVIVYIEQVILQAAETEGRQQADQEDVTRPQQAPLLQEGGKGARSVGNRCHQVLTGSGDRCLLDYQTDRPAAARDPGFVTGSRTIPG